MGVLVEVLQEMVKELPLISQLFYLEVRTIKLHWLGLALWCLTPLSTIFQLCRGSQSVLFVEETGGPGENHRPVASH